jgi:hypothetical protein
MRGRAALAAVVIALAACGPRETPGDAAFKPPPDKIGREVCVMLSPDEVAAILGAPVASYTEEAENAGQHPGCSWFSVEQPDGQRTLTATVWREKALKAESEMLSGEAFFEDQAAALRAEFARVGTIEGVGEAGVMGLEPQENGLIEGAILARKGADVLTLTMQGVDPAGFEDAASRIAAAM